METCLCLNHQGLYECEWHDCLLCLYLYWLSDRCALSTYSSFVTMERVRQSVIPLCCNNGRKDQWQLVDQIFQVKQCRLWRMGKLYDCIHCPLFLLARVGNDMGHCRAVWGKNAMGNHVTYDINLDDGHSLWNVGFTVVSPYLIWLITREDFAAVNSCFA
jgi:hypothetical protein